MRQGCPALFTSRDCYDCDMHIGIPAVPWKGCPTICCSNCTHRGLVCFLDEYVKTCGHGSLADICKAAKVTFSVIAEEKFTELLRLEASDALNFMQEVSGLYLIPDLCSRNVLLSCSLDLLPWVADVIDHRDQMSSSCFEVLETIATASLIRFLKLCTDAKNTKLASPLLLAAARRRVWSKEVFSLIESAAADLNFCDKNGSVLHEAVRCSSARAIRFLVAKGEVF